MTAWKRWSWRYRVGTLFALALLLQGCLFAGGFHPNDPTFTVPGVGEVFTTHDLTVQPGGAYVLKEIDPATGRYWRIVPGDPRYNAIDSYFRNRPQAATNQPDRVTIPGGAGSLPAPPVQ